MRSSIDFATSPATLCMSATKSSGKRKSSHIAELLPRHLGDRTHVIVPERAAKAALLGGLATATQVAALLRRCV
jgi:hypothetical protein